MLFKQSVQGILIAGVLLLGSQVAMAQSTNSLSAEETAQLYLDATFGKDITRFNQLKQYVALLKGQGKNALRWKDFEKVSRVKLIQPVNVELAKRLNKELGLSNAKISDTDKAALQTLVAQIVDVIMVDTDFFSVSCQVKSAEALEVSKGDVLQTEIRAQCVSKSLDQEKLGNVFKLDVRKMTPQELKASLTQVIAVSKAATVEDPPVNLRFVIKANPADHRWYMTADVFYLDVSLAMTAHENMRRAQAASIDESEEEAQPASADE